jgi:uncharacterized protein (DUF2141 family)
MISNIAPMPKRPHPSSSLILLRLARYLCLVPCALSLAYCANQGSLTGGPKDEKPPEIVTSEPANFSTHFKASRVEITFDEYIDLKDISKQLVVSPPMAKKPEIKKNGRKLEILFKDSLLPNRTYALNFGDALTDLNEGNPIKNFQYVFSTGASLDSLQVAGIVLNALDGKPAEDILVMLYSGDADSLPLKTIPLYISRTGKDGRFTLKNLAGGKYKIFALKDGNTNYKFDMPSEAVAFTDSLISPSVVMTPKSDSLKPVNDTLLPLKDSLAVKKDSIAAPKPDPGYHFIPDNIELHMFTEVKPNQYLAGAERPMRNQIRIRFNERTDSLRIEFPGLNTDSMALAVEWTEEPDTIDFWIDNPAVAARDSIEAILLYPGYDSIGRLITKRDTVRLRYKPAAKPATAPKKDFTVSVSVEGTKMLEFGKSLIITTSHPFIQLDTTRIRLVSGNDSTAREVPYRMTHDSLSGWVLNGSPVRQAHPRIIRLDAPFMADSSYRITLLPGVFTNLAGAKNDSLDVRFKMKGRDLYGTVKIILPDLQGHGIIELNDSRSKVVASHRMNGAGTAVFDLLAPGKYTARLIFDSNGNGRWDTGRYIKHIQPEKVMTFTKELNVKANWEVTETWQWEEL